MVSFKIEWNIPEVDTDEWDYEFVCPFCRLETPITFGDLRREEYFICRGCHRTIRAIDKLGDLQRLRDNLRNLFK